MPTAVPVTGPITVASLGRGAEPAGLLRSILILTVASFVIGFVGFLAMNGPALQAPAGPEQTAAIAQPADAAAAPAALPTTDDWNLPKAI